MTAIDPTQLNRYKALVNTKRRLESLRDFFNQELNKVRNRKSIYENISNQLGTTSLQLSNSKSALYLQMADIMYIPSEANSPDASVRKAARAAFRQLKVIEAKIQQKDRELSILFDQRELTTRVLQILSASEEKILLLRNRNAQRLLAVETEIQNYYQA